MSFTIDPQPTQSDLYQGAVKVATAWPSGLITRVTSPAAFATVTAAGKDQVTYLNLPDGITEVDFMFCDIDHPAASANVFQLGTASGWVQSGYNGVTTYTGASTGSQTSDVCVPFLRTGVGQLQAGTIRCRLVDKATNCWIVEGNGHLISGASLFNVSCAARGIFLPSRLTQVRLASSGAGNFVSGRCNITYR
jgi:hypothetical protein